MNTSQIKTISYTGSLWRADKNSSSIYSNTNIKYFALSEPEIQTYVERAHRQYKKHWATKMGQELNLVNILDLKTRMALDDNPKMSKEALKNSFPVNKGKVSRVSDFKPDDTVLRGLCSLGYDGYYMKNLTNNKGNYVFHSEIGLCRNAFSKIELKETKINKSQAPNIPVKKRPLSRTRRNNNNNNGTRRRRQFTLNNNNNNNNNSFPKGSLF